MKSKISNPYFHLLFWLVVTVILIFVYGHSWNNNLNAFYFIALLLPVVMGTSYFFNFYLVPVLLLKKKYLRFALYFYYTLVVSLYLQILVVFFSFMYLANFELEDMGPNSISEIRSLAIVMYAVVFAGSFLVMLQQLVDQQKELEQFKIEKEKLKKQFLELLSNRNKIRISYDEIVYIESLSDYVKVHTINQKEITSKEKISVISEKLPEDFLRIHRSFIVNRNQITRFNYNEIEIGGVVLNIGRSYKKDILPKLKLME